MTRTGYSLDQFIADMQAIVAEKPTQAALFDKGSSLLERLVHDPEAVPEQFRVPAGKGSRPNHGSYALHRSPGLFVSSVVWGPGDYAGPHDHQTWGMIGVLSNEIHETRFRRLDDRTREDYAQLEKVGPAVVKRGQVSLLVPHQDEIHEMRNPSDRLTVEIHVYGRDLVGLPRYQYDLNTGAMKRWASGKFDNC
jgi:predicted metal-dependent enzyme (double-stranded beta helix superfamily)